MSDAKFLSLSQRDCSVRMLNLMDGHFNLYLIRCSNSAKEWINICDRPDLMRRLEEEDININNFYVCELHFENQIMEFATRKILIRTAQPIPIGGTNFDPRSLLASDHLDSEPAFDHVDLDQDDDEFDGGL